MNLYKLRIRSTSPSESPSPGVTGRQLRIIQEFSPSHSRGRGQGKRSIVQRTPKAGLESYNIDVLRTVMDRRGKL